MPKIHVVRQHSFSREEAVEQLQALMQSVQSDLARFIDKIDWADDRRSADVKGALFTGRFALNGASLTVDLDVSILAVLFMEKIRKRIDETLDKFLAGDSGHP